MRAIKQIKRFFHREFGWEFTLNKEFKRDAIGFIFFFAILVFILSLGLI